VVVVVVVGGSIGARALVVVDQGRPLRCAAPSMPREHCFFGSSGLFVGGFRPS